MPFVTPLATARGPVYTGAYLESVRHLGVGEHKWRHVRGHGESTWVTVLIDLTPVVDGTGPALDLILGPLQTGPQYLV